MSLNVCLVTGISRVSVSLSLCVYGRDSLLPRFPLARHLSAVMKYTRAAVVFFVLHTA
jgi:hypothetical protein